MKIEDDLRTALGRAARSADPSAGAFERTLERRALGTGRPPEPSGGSRLAAAAVALVVATAGIVFAIMAFGGEEERIAEPSPAPVTNLDGTSWVLTTLDDESVVRGTEESWMTLTFRNTDYTVRSGCNRTGGSYTIDAGWLLPEGGELITCGPGLDASQQTLFDALWVRSDATMQGATLTLDTGEHQLSFVQDPCSLLTSNEVGAAVGSAVESAGLVPPSGMKLPGSGPVCSFEVPESPYSSVGVQIETSSLQDFETEAAADEANFFDVAGVGETAYISAMNSIVVFDAGRSISIGVQHGAGAAAVPVLEELGRAAVDAAHGNTFLPDTLLKLNGTAWELAYVDGRSWPVGDERSVTLAFGADRLTGFDGCNEFGASWRLDQERLVVGELAGTQIACGGEAAWVAQRVRTILATLPSVGLALDELRLVSPNGVLDFEAAPDAEQPREEESFIPATTTHGSTTTLPLVFPDGSRAVLRYPSELQLAQRGLAPNLQIHLDDGARCGWDGIIGYDSLRDDVYAGEGPIFAVDGRSSHVEVWKGAKGYLPNYLVIHEDTWDLAVPCQRSDQAEAEARAWADTLRLSTTPEGFLVVEATPPVVIEGPESGDSFSGPELYFLEGDTVEGATGVLTVGIATRCPEGDDVAREPGWARRCFQSERGALILTIQTEGNSPAERSYLDEVVRGVEVTDLVLSTKE